MSLEGTTGCGWRHSHPEKSEASDASSIELILAFAVVVANACLCIIAVLNSSSDYMHQNFFHSYYFEEGLFGLPRDVSNLEWETWRSDVVLFVCLSFIHCMLFNYVAPLLAVGCQRWACIVVWMLLNVVIYGITTVAFVTVFAIGMLLCSLSIACKSAASARLFVWALPCSCLLYVNVMTDFDDEQFDPISFSRRSAFVAYKFLQCISICLHFLDNSSLHNSSPIHSSAVELLSYIFYWPTSVLLIVPYSRFQDLMHQRRFTNPWNLMSLIIRVLIWTTVCELVPHILFMNAFMRDPEVLRTLTPFSLAAVGYSAGQYFHMMYMSEFGIPAIFAKIDGIEPPWPPICISRVALYSQMWRYFDRGLYAFLQLHIFLPLIRVRAGSVFASVACFAFIWLWHGGTTHFTWWVCLNMVELGMERIGRLLWINYGVADWFNRHLSLRNVRRLVAVSQIPCIIIGVTSITFFLGTMDGETGLVFVRSLIVAPFSGSWFGLIYALIICYCFSQCSIELTKMFKCGY